MEAIQIQVATTTGDGVTETPIDSSGGSDDSGDFFGDLFKDWDFQTIGMWAGAVLCCMLLLFIM